MTTGKAPVTEEETGAPLLEARGINKYFGAITALRDVSLSLYPGKVLVDKSNAADFK